MSEESLPKKIGQWPVQLKTYVGELKTEMRRVTWPNKKQVQSTTLVVIVTVFAFAGYFAIVDLLLGRAIGKVFDTFAQ
ncbi:MAG: preprotein translocase subunit SecE [bacterium]|nr:preprotein translocase subunit SecE [bacterium]